MATGITGKWKYKGHAFDRDIYLLGKGKDGRNYFLAEATFDCDWYYGLGYVETYTNNNAPERARDIASHQHFDGLFFKGKRSAYDEFCDFFEETPFGEKEIWKILELMKSAYIAREYSDMLHRGDANYSTNPASETIKDKREYDRINKVVLPEIMYELYKILGGEEGHNDTAI